MLSWYLQLVRILFWAIELVRIDIFHETLLMLQYQNNPCIGHLEVPLHIFAYLRSHIIMGRIGYDHMGPNVDFWCSIIIWIGQNFMGTLRKNYLKRKRRHGVGL